MKTSTIFLLTIFIYGTTFSQVKFNPYEKISDSIFKKHLNAREYLTGGVINVVNKDSILLAKGYGLSDRESKIAFLPSETTVQIASVSKLITTTAVLKLLENGKIDLDRPIKEYLPNLKYDNPYNNKVLVKHLLTHTGGFDDRSGFMESHSLDEVPSLKEYAENYIPSVAWKPGEFFNYSNYSFVILAYLVETVSGTSFENYLDQQILQPLDMNQSGFGYDEKLANNLMKRYRLRENDKNEIYTQEADPRYPNLWGATGFKTTAQDMSNFIMMYLNQGNYNGKQILKKETIDLAFRTQFTYDNTMSRQQGLGWRVNIKDGKKLLYHYGDDTGVESSLVLYPEKNIGLFTAFNNPVGFNVKTEIQNRIFEELYGLSSDTSKEMSSSITSLDKIVGDYFYMNDSHTTFEKIGFLLGNRKINVSTAGDTLQIGSQKFLETNTPLLFKEIDTELQVKFIKNENNEIGYYSYGTSTYRRIGKFEDPSLHLKIALVCILVYIVYLIIVLWRHIGNKLIKKNTGDGRLVNITGLNTLFLLFFGVGFAIATNTISTLSYGISDAFKALFIFPILATVLLPISIIILYKDFKKSQIPKWLKGFMIVDLCSILIFLLILNSYNLVGFNFI